MRFKHDSRTARRRWPQFTIRTLLAFTAVFALWLGIVVDRARKQERAVAAITKSRGIVFYGHGLDHNWDPTERKRIVPSWLRDLIGEDFFADVVAVEFRNGQPTDADLAPLADLSNLQRLDFVDASRVSDAGLIHLRDLTSLRVLVLNDAAVSNRGLKHLERLKNLKYLVVQSNEVSDVGLQYLVRLHNLEELLVESTEVSDIGLQYLARLKKLKCLVLLGTSVSSAGVEKLKKELPNTEVNVFGGAAVQDDVSVPKAVPLPLTTDN